MKQVITRYTSVILLSIFILHGCKDVLDVQPKSELGGAYLATENGIQTVLNGAYGQQNNAGFIHSQTKVYPMIPTFIAYGRGGALETVNSVPLENFQFENARFLPTWWDNYYTGIRNANVVINRLKVGDFTDAFKNEKLGEAKALRGYFYYQLYQYFGPVPIFTEEVPDELEKARSTDEEIKALIEQDLSEAGSLLPVQQELFGEITRGAALGLLTKFYLNTKQWQKTIDTGEQVIDLGIYGLVPNYADIYSQDNEGNEEAVWPVVHNNDRFTNITALTAPGDYPLPEGTRSFAGVLFVYDWFVDSFGPNDTRNDAPLIIREYVNTSGNLVQGYGNDESAIFKYPPPPPGGEQKNPIDMMAVRYADILLSIAEARNEVQGPNQESIDLINDIRDRAGADPIQLGDFASREELRGHILNERLWELYMEGTEQQDMIRHGVFISNAQANGVTTAQEFHRLFPIPDSELESNSKMVQNPGY